MGDRRKNVELSVFKWIEKRMLMNLPGKQRFQVSTQMSEASMNLPAKRRFQVSRQMSDPVDRQLLDANAFTKEGTDSSDEVESVHQNCVLTELAHTYESDGTEGSDRDDEGNLADDEMELSPRPDRCAFPVRSDSRLESREF